MSADDWLGIVLAAALAAGELVERRRGAAAPAAPVPPAVRGCCGCRWALPAAYECRWAAENPLPYGMPFWMSRPATVRVDAEEGRDCSAFEPAQVARDGER